MIGYSDITYEFGGELEGLEGEVDDQLATQRTPEANSTHPTLKLDVQGGDQGRAEKSLSEKMKLNIANPATGEQKTIDFDDERRYRVFYEKRIAQEVPGDSLGDEFKGYVFRITGGNDKQGFPMKQGVLLPYRVRLLLSDGHSCYRTRRTGERKRKSVRGCIVGPDIAVLSLVIVKQGDAPLPGLTENVLPKRLGPKRATKIRKFFNLGKEDDVRKFVVRREVHRKKNPDAKPYFKAPKIQRLVTPLRLQRRRHLRAIKRKRIESAKEQKAEFDELVAKRVAEKKQKIAAKAASHKKAAAATTTTAHNMALEKNISQDSFTEYAYDEKHLAEDEPQTRETRNRAVREAVEKGDLYSLRMLSKEPGGFQDARSVAWPFLLHVNNAPNKTHEPKEETGNSQDDQPSSAPVPRSPHRDERQVGLDTNRAFVHYPVESQQRKEKRKKQLTELILSVLERHPQLSYFQGYHDILSTLQLTLHPSLERDEEAWHLLRECALKITLHRARDAMGVGLEPLTGQLRILRRLLRIADPELAILIEDASPLPYWAISPLMTLYTHDLPTLALAQRVMDWILARPPNAVIYLVAAFVLRKKAEIQKLVDDGDDGMMHSFLSSLPELEADELPDPVDTHDADSSFYAPFTSDSSTTNLTSPSCDLESLKDSWTHSPVTPIELPPYSEQSPALTEEARDTPKPVDRATPTPPSPTSSLSSLPPQGPSVDHRDGPTVPLSQVLQAADSLRTKFPFSHEKLRLEETLGPHSMLRTWSDDPEEIIGDDTAEEYVLATDQIVYPDMDDDVFEPYPPPLPNKPSDTRLARLPKLNMALTVGLPMVAVLFAVVTSSPTTRAQLKQGSALAYNFAEVGFGLMS
ncbi:unnamed protein product [Rhizoctonia solani]|uniref:Rab-GAP TBC domain-containing protein n=1 Tax=Rhizoctonia solani TaxID=456999 RepID=A0A8H3DSE6_9AGAM|nr:unnamed protein product [Rhizoctonia solani]